MTLPEWTKQIMDELAAAGFEVSEFQGFPLVKRPEKHEEGVRLLKFQTSFACDRQIFHEGMVFTPTDRPGNLQFNVRQNVKL